ncbi:hypothetical protein ACLI1A_00370 [Flavobacterium sp. RHBU_3]|uniref:hypothetical protein n=1 Tax=Flavobacterium sp. RHBU_3 TaxID=3391184 RepID=UPI0039851D10
MGLDIYLRTDNIDEIYDLLNENEAKYSLSRTFCNFMCRRNVLENHEAELDQIGAITNVDISPIYDMENYVEEEELEYYLETFDTEDEKQENRISVEYDRKKLEGNIDIVLTTISSLISKLNSINSIQNLLIKTDFDTLNNDVYFSDFESNKGDGYINNNFGHDLRNFKLFLELAKQNNATTVWFMYG